MVTTSTDLIKISNLQAQLVKAQQSGDSSLVASIEKQLASIFSNQNNASSQGAIESNSSIFTSNKAAQVNSQTDPQTTQQANDIVKIMQQILARDEQQIKDINNSDPMIANINDPKQLRELAKMFTTKANQEQQKLNSLNAKKAQLVSQLNSLKSQKNSLEAERENKQQQVEEKTVLRQQKLDNAAKLESEAKNLKSQAQSLLNATKTITVTNADGTTSTQVVPDEEKRAQGQQMMAEAQKKEKEAAKLRQEAQVLQNEIDELNQEIQDINSEIQSVKEQISDTRQKLQSVQTQINNSSALINQYQKIAQDCIQKAELLENKKGIAGFISGFFNKQSNTAAVIAPSANGLSSESETEPVIQTEASNPFNSLA